MIRSDAGAIFRPLPTCKIADSPGSDSGDIYLQAFFAIATVPPRKTGAITQTADETVRIAVCMWDRSVSMAQVTWQICMATIDEGRKSDMDSADKALNCGCQSNPMPFSDST